MKLKRTDFPWSAEQVALRDGKVLQALSLHGVGVAGKNGDKLRVRMSVAGRLINVATFTFYQRAEAARVADMATLFFWDYRTKPTVLGDHLFNFSVASAESDLASLSPALVGVRERFCALLALHKMEKGVSASKVKRDDANKILSARITDLTHRLDTLEKRLEHRDQTVALLVAQVKTCLDAMPHINRRLDAVESGLTCSNTAQATLERSIGSIGANSLHANQADHNAKIAQLEEFVTTLQPFLEALKPAIEETDSRVRRIETQINIKQ